MKRIGRFTFQFPRPYQWKLSENLKVSYKTIDISYWGREKRYYLEIIVWRKKAPYYPIQIGDRIKEAANRDSYLDGSKEIKDRNGKNYVSNSYKFLFFKFSISYFVSK